MRLEALFTRPILAWDGISGRFFSMVHDALVGKIVVNPSDLSVNPASVLGDARARYNIFGGGTSVTLHSDKLVFDFPGLIPPDYELVRDVMLSIHDAFPTAFPEANYDRLEAQSLDHLELLESGAVGHFLDRYRLPEIDRSFSSPVVSQPQVKFTVVAQDQSWQCSLAVERSLVSATALFAVLNVSLRNVSPSAPFLDKARTINKLANSCLRVVGLENINASVQ
jgi:hypothetical protein